MKSYLLVAFLVALPLGQTHAARPVRVKSTITKKGTYRQPHSRTSPNRTKTDNWGTKGNVNPTTGKSGTKRPQ